MGYETASMFKELTGIYAFTFAFQFITTCVLAYSIIRGRGWQGKPWGPYGPPESNFIGVAVCSISTFLYLAKTVEFARGGGAFISFNKYWYSDYLMTCPMIVADLSFSLDLPYKLINVVFTAILLGFAVLSFTEGYPDKYIHFAFGSFLFLILYGVIINMIRARWDIFPEKSKKFLLPGLFIFFAVWPLFPILWLLSFNNDGPFDADVFYIIHAFLDITCKTIFSFCMMLFRLEVESWELANSRGIFSLENFQDLLTGTTKKKPAASGKKRDSITASSSSSPAMSPMQPHSALRTFTRRYSTKGKPESALFTSVAYRHEMLGTLEEYLINSMELMRSMAEKNANPNGIPSQPSSQMPSQMPSRSQSPRASVLRIPASPGSRAVSPVEPEFTRSNSFLPLDNNLDNVL